MGSSKNIIELFEKPEKPVKAKEAPKSLTPDKLELERKTAEGWHPGHKGATNDIIELKKVPVHAAYSPFDPHAGSIAYFYKIDGERVFDQHYYLLNQASERFREHIKIGNSGPKPFLQAMHALHHAILYHDLILAQNFFKIYWKIFMHKLKLDNKKAKEDTTFPASRDLIQKNHNELKSINKLAKERHFKDMTETDRAIYIHKNSDINFTRKATVNRFLEGKSVSNFFDEVHKIEEEEEKLKKLVQLRRIILTAKNAELELPDIFKRKSADAHIAEVTTSIGQIIQDSISAEEKKIIEHINAGELEFKRMSIAEIKKVLDVLEHPYLQDFLTVREIFKGQSLESLKSKFQEKLRHVQEHAEIDEFWAQVDQSPNSEAFKKIIEEFKNPKYGGYEWIRGASLERLNALQEIMALAVLSDAGFKDIFGHADKPGLIKFLAKNIENPISKEIGQADFPALLKVFLDDYRGETPDAGELLSNNKFLKLIDIFPAFPQEIKKYFVVDGYYSDTHIARLILANYAELKDDDVAKVKQAMKACIRAFNMHKRGGV